MNTIRHIVLFLAVSHFFVQAQDYNDLVNQKDHLLKETKLLNQVLLDESNKKLYHRKLNIINTKINLQTELLDIYQKSINTLVLEQREIEDTIKIVGNYLKNYKKTMLI